MVRFLKFSWKRLTFGELVARLKKRSGGAFFSADPQQAVLARTPQCTDKKRSQPKGQASEILQNEINVWRTEMAEPNPDFYLRFVPDFGLTKPLSAQLQITSFLLKKRVCCLCDTYASLL